MKATFRIVTCAVAAVTACASDPPPKPVEPASAPLDIPPLPPKKDPPERPMTRDVPPPSPAEPADEGAEGVPGPLALPCKTDAECMTHRCNLRYGKCAFPCQSDRDCISGATCFTGAGAMSTCIPKSP
jgi:hypothetical protein